MERRDNFCSPMVPTSHSVSGCQVANRFKAGVLVIKAY